MISNELKSVLTFLVGQGNALAELKALMETDIKNKMPTCEECELRNLQAEYRAIGGFIKKIRKLSLNITKE